MTGTPQERERSIRQEITDLLLGREMTARDLSQALRIREREVVTHLEHIRKSLAPQGRSLVLTEARCLSCGFVFLARRRLSPPGRCPACRHSHLQRPGYRIL